MELDEDYKRLREAIVLLQEAALALADVEVAEIRFKAPKSAMYDFHYKLMSGTPAIERIFDHKNPNELITLEGIILSRTPWTKQP